MPFLKKLEPVSYTHLWQKGCFQHPEGDGVESNGRQNRLPGRPSAHMAESWFGVRKRVAEIHSTAPVVEEDEEKQDIVFKPETAS